jgi:chromosome segregation ATPase
MEVSHSEIIIDSLETMCNLQIEQIELYDGFVLADSKVIIELNEKIKAYQAYNDALEGRTRKLADAYQFRERDLLEGMEMLRQELHQLNEEYEDLEARAAKFGEVAREQVMDLMNETKRLKEQLRLCGPQGPILHSPPIPDCR